MKQKDLAKQLGITPIYLNAILKRRAKPSIKLALRIDELSNGKYKATDFRDELNYIVTLDK